MIYLLDIIVDSYSQFMAIINFVCFGSVCICIAYIFVVVALGQLSYWYKRLAIGAVVTLVVLFSLHFILADFGITLLVPPVNTIYFTEFMRIIQYIASVSIVLVATYVFVAAALSRADKRYSQGVVSGMIYLAILVIIHLYILENFGIKIIFPPNLW